MEKWREFAKDIIPKGNYETKLTFGEESGLIIELVKEDTIIALDFGAIFSVRILDEGIVQTHIHNEKEIMKYKNNSFSNVIYEIENGQYEKELKKMSGGYLDVIDYHHYIVITQNYSIDIIAGFPPDIIINGDYVKLNVK